MIFRRRRSLPHALPLLREPPQGYTPPDTYSEGEIEEVRARLDEFREQFHYWGERLASRDEPLKDPLSAMMAGSSLNAPFLGIATMKGRPRTLVLDAIAAEGTPQARSALLAMATAADGELGAQAAATAAGMDRGIKDPEWVRNARRPLRSLTFDRLVDRDDAGVRALLVEMRHSGWASCFFLRFHPGSLLAARIDFLTSHDRIEVLSDLNAGGERGRPYWFSRREDVEEVPGAQMRYIRDIIVQNERAVGAKWLSQVPRLGRLGTDDVVPGQMVALRKCVTSAFGVSDWRDPNHYPVWS